MIFCIPCLVLISYFAIASIFVPKYRLYIKEAWQCFLDKLRGKKCSISFDNRMRLAVSMWFAEKNMPRIGKFLHDERNFKITLTMVGVVFTVISIFLFIVLLEYLAHPPCEGDVCSIG